MEHVFLLVSSCLGAVRERMCRFPNFFSNDFFVVLKKPFTLVHVGFISWAAGIGMIFVGFISWVAGIGMTGATGSKSQGPNKDCLSTHL